MLIVVMRLKEHSSFGLGSYSNFLFHRWANPILPTHLPRPKGTERDEWIAYWQAQGLPWRTEPEISDKRQEELSKCRATPAHIVICQWLCPHRTCYGSKMEWTHYDSI